MGSNQTKAKKRKKTPNRTSRNDFKHAIHEGNKTEVKNVFLVPVDTII